MDKTSCLNLEDRCSIQLSYGSPWRSHVNVAREGNQARDIESDT
jgi:hypothetical protein